MIADLKPYPAYRDSGLPWLGKVPEHWKQRRTKFLFRERVQKGYPDEPLLAATQSKGVVRKDEYGSRTVTATQDLHLLKLVEQGDYVISLRSFEGGIEVAHSRGIISPAYTVLAPQKEASHGYYTHFFKSPDFIRSLTLFVTGIREGQNIDYERLSRAYLPLPPPDEQTAIVRFLNWANGQLDKAIRAKRKVITLLNEQKQAIIHRAVTRGLDPSVPLKPSGIPWLGDIPQHWEVRKLKFEMRFCGGGTPSKGNLSYWNGSIPWVSPKDMKTEIIRDTIDHITERAVAQSSTNLVPAGSLLMVVRSGILQRIIPVAKSICEVALNQDMKSLTSKGRLDLDYFALFIRGCEKQLLHEWTKQGATVESIEHHYLSNTKVPIPPIQEQQQILEQLVVETAPLTTAISRFEREIELLREYRTRLVADVVTGKLDVREAVMNLPDEALIDLPDNNSVEGLEDEPFEEEAIL